MDSPESSDGHERLGVEVSVGSSDPNASYAVGGQRSYGCIADRRGDETKLQEARSRSFPHTQTEMLQEELGKQQQLVKALERQLAVAEQRERERIAKILHDDLQQQLYSAQIQFAFLRDHASDVTTMRGIEQMEQLVEGAVETARRLTVELSPPLRPGEGFVEAVRWFAVHMRQQYGLQVKVEADDPLILPDVLQQLLFQAVRELLFNVVKHAGRAAATVRLSANADTQTGEVFLVEVEDDGVGFDPKAVLEGDEAPDGWGLPHMKRRLGLAGGRLIVASAPHEGTRVTIFLGPTRKEFGGQANATAGM